MSASTRVFHHGPKPISLTEFRDALEAVCLPRFPTVRFARPRRVALAVSGGVDSMAMAFLFSSLFKTHQTFKIADNPAESAFGIVIDHQLREGSDAEASSVAHELKRIGIKAIIKTLNWRDVRRDGMNPASLPNLESVARTMRYQVLGLTCGHLQATSLFFAHHSDDHYETILMRLLAGHGYRGLQGIRAANAIPECYELHGVYKSGILDDQMQRQPFLSFKPPNKELKQLRMILRDDFHDEPWSHIKTYLGINDISAQFPGHITRDIDPRVPYLTPLNCEDGGVHVYRPLLEFDKDRLIATCEANRVRWFEDHTNTDPTLTTRNALRYIARSYKLPEALQKPAVLALARRAKQKTNFEEAEAHRLLIREAVIQDFDPNAGTLLIELPSFVTSASRARRLYAASRDEARRPRRRAIAAIAVRKLVDFVTPYLHSPSRANLDSVIDRLFPELSSSRQGEVPKAFSIAGVVFEPILGPQSTRWFLSRAPYKSNHPLPERKLPGHLGYKLISGTDGFKGPQVRHGPWRSWKMAKIWDGRFWIRLNTCVPARFHIRPLQPQFARQFRLALPQKERYRLEKILRYYAPGKVRYSLPALYSVESGEGTDPATPTMTLLALPSLGIHVPGLERWVKCEVRYKNVDVSLLGLQRRGGQRPLVVYRPRSGRSRQVRRRRLANRMRTGGHACRVCRRGRTSTAHG
ncbi:tRNA(Ile)-lysidine synthetase [Purpureocillium takamizusanense]|uniref:tRNA(Ile)-lysidine synthetase n=1 Tax=Purpureocillium takamizusanense TaxID=2060973 RepID=A0A9Q8QBD4_9HYPO|nr:tRNA(Ile)-lysidine synthetase [Purpureocillium takamizusanense]UNI16152.1 tRNA(Ile)-lysidine synthetase [Purpureocillium takamizusanense]